MTLSEILNVLSSTYGCLGQPRSIAAKPRKAERELSLQRQPRSFSSRRSPITPRFCCYCCCRRLLSVLAITLPYLVLVLTH
ncbi:hypothetical protein BJY04DRAFT_176468 [Aspergillus karnatakaensis]|uniref:uncharacterized protein n=1 Tax=Aspergillus karnatakaensis TaxID=1810916 RepID=UPI003CCD1535